MNHANIPLSSSGFQIYPDLREEVPNQTQLLHPLRLAIESLFLLLRIHDKEFQHWPQSPVLFTEETPAVVSEKRGKPSSAGHGVSDLSSFPVPSPSHSAAHSTRLHLPLTRMWPGSALCIHPLRCELYPSRQWIVSQIWVEETNLKWLNKCVQGHTIINIYNSLLHSLFTGKSKSPRTEFLKLGAIRVIF